MGSAQSQDASGWELKKEQDGVRIYTRKSAESSIKEVRLELVLEASLDNVVAVLRDPDNYASWVYNCEEARLVELKSPKTCYYYSRINFPWPLQDRDVVAHSVLTQDPATGKVMIRSVAKPDRMPEIPQAIRIARMESCWTITPLGDGRIKLENHLWSDPGGSLPAWLVNLAIDKGPTETIARLRERIKEDKYRNARLSYLN